MYINASKADPVSLQNMNDPLQYQKSSDLQKSQTLQAIPRFLNYIDKSNLANENVLDIGCGPGDVTDFLYHSLKNVKSLIGIDRSDQMLSHAKQNYGSEKVTYEKFDIELDRVPIHRQEYFQHIFSFYCLHWIKNHRNSIRNMYDFLSHNGDISLLFGASHPLQPGYNLLVSKGKWSKHIQEDDLTKYLFPKKSAEPITAEFYEILLEDEGFTVKMCRVDSISYPCNSRNKFKDLVKAVDPFLMGLPLELRDEYIEDVIDVMFETNFITHDGHGGYLIHYQLVSVFAVKT